VPYTGTPCKIPSVAGVGTGSLPWLQLTNPFPKGIGDAIIFLTARDSEADITKGLALGGDAYIAKPFPNDKLVTMVKAHLD
jgi:CheY-like chemotaxis protein